MKQSTKKIPEDIAHTGEQKAILVGEKVPNTKTTKHKEYEEGQV